MKVSKSSQTQTGCTLFKDYCKGLSVALGPISTRHDEFTDENWTFHRADSPAPNPILRDELLDKILILKPFESVRTTLDIKWADASTAFGARPSPTAKWTIAQVPVVIRAYIERERDRRLFKFDYDRPFEIRIRELSISILQEALKAISSAPGIDRPNWIETFDEFATHVSRRFEMEE